MSSKGSATRRREVIEPMPTLREEHKRLTRSRLVDAALDVFHEVGFQAATVEQIARRAGTNRATFYLHFKAKEDLYGAIAERVLPVYAAQYTRLGEMTDPSVAEICEWLEEMEKWGREFRLMHEVRSMAMAVSPGLSAEWVRAVEDVVSHDVGYLSQFDGEALAAAKTRLVFVGMMLERYVYVTRVGGVTFSYPNSREVLAGMLRELLWPQSAAGCDGADAAGD